MMIFTLVLIFQTLYESSIAFGIRKALQAEQGKTDMENYIAKLEEEKAALEKEVSILVLTEEFRQINFFRYQI